MTEDEIYDMIIMCTQACRENKALQRFDSRENAWSETRMAIHLIVNAIVCDGRKFRVKPEPKTVIARIYWIKGSDNPCFAANINFAMLQSSPKFRSWACDEQILTVPEV